MPSRSQAIGTSTGPPPGCGVGLSSPVFTPKPRTRSDHEGYNCGPRADKLAARAGCGPVEFFADISDWVDENSVPMAAEHGHIRVCTGCL